MEIRRKLPVLLIALNVIAAVATLVMFIHVTQDMRQGLSLRFSDAEARQFRERNAAGDDAVTADTREKLTNRDYERGYLWGAFMENFCKAPLDAALKTHLAQCALHRETTLGEPKKD